MAIEVGKNRMEALGEVEEAADLIRYYAKTMEDNAGYDHPMDNLGDAAVHTRSILRPHGVFARHQPVQLPDGPRRRPGLGGDDGRQHGRAQAGIGVAAVGREPRRGAIGTRACRPASSTWSWARATRSAQALQDEPGHRRHRVHRLVRGRVSALPQSFSTHYPRPCIVEMGGKNPAIVTAQRGPRGGGRGDHARRPSGSAARSARPTAASTSSGRSTTTSSGCSSRRPRSSSIGDPLPREPTGSARSSTSAAVDRHQQAVAEARRDGTRVHRRRAPDRWRPGPRLLRRADGRRGCRRRHRLFRDELFAPFTAVATVGLAGRGARPRQRQRLRPDRGRLQRGSGRGRSGSSTRSTPACCTSTGGPARPPAPGRASRPSAAGRAAAPPARPACRCTTSRSSCASRATPSSTERPAPPARASRAAAPSGRTRVLDCQ